MTQNVTPLPSSSLALYAEHDTIWYGISPGSVGVSCPGCVSSQLLVHSQLTPLYHIVLSTLSSAQFQKSPILAAMEKNNAVPAHTHIYMHRHREYMCISDLSIVERKNSEVHLKPSQIYYLSYLGIRLPGIKVSQSHLQS